MGPRINAWLAGLAPGLGVPGFYGMVGLGLLAGALLFRFRAPREGLPPAAERALAEAFPLAMLGSLLLPALFALPDALAARDPIRLWQNGLVSYAGYASGVAALAWRSRARGLPLGRMLDAVAPGVGAGIGLGRWGCFFAGCDFGAPTRLPWGVRFPEGSQAFQAQVADGRIAPFQALSLPVHPTELYEVTLGWLLLALALWGRPARAGARFARVAAGYACGRLGIELFRGDGNRGFALGLSTGQLASLAVLAAVAAWHLWARPAREAAA